MSQYIDKSALLAEMKKEIKCIYAGREYVGIPMNEERMVMGIQKVEDIISILEVQNLDDIKKEWYNKGYLKGRKEAYIPARELGLPKAFDFKPLDDDFERDAVSFCFDNGLNTTPHIAKTIAKHFYELGKTVGNKAQKGVSMEEFDKYFSGELDPNIQYASREQGIKAFAEEYSFNIESELFNQLTKEQQALWRKEIEQAVINGGEEGLELARDIRYKENVEVKEVDLELITGWFDHIAQIADDRMTLTNQRMTDAHALDEIKCLAKNSSEFITKHYKAQKGEEV